MRIRHQFLKSSLEDLRYRTQAMLSMSKLLVLTLVVTVQVCVFAADELPAIGGAPPPCNPMAESPMSQEILLHHESELLAKLSGILKACSHRVVHEY